MECMKSWTLCRCLRQSSVYEGFEVRCRVLKRGEVRPATTECSFGGNARRAVGEWEGEGEDFEEEEGERVGNCCLERSTVLGDGFRGRIRDGKTRTIKMFR